jgi:hypothetical protein
MAAAISSSFDITYDGPLSGSAVTITNPGRAFRIVGITSYGVATAVCKVGKNNVVAGLVGTATSATTDLGTDGVMLLANLANATFTASDNVVIDATVAALNRAIIHCVAIGGGQSLKVA